MKVSNFSRSRGFTLLETVIAIGVLAVLLTGFMVVFAPAADGIRKSINVQQADRLASTVEQELVTLHKGETTGDVATGFDKAFKMLSKGATADEALMVYQYRGSVAGALRDDDTPAPVPDLKDAMPGKDYVVVSMMRSVKDTKFRDDLPAVEGVVYMVKCTQLVFGGGELKLGTPGKIVDPKTGDGADTAAAYPEAVIAFSADFYMMPAKSMDYFTSVLPTKFDKLIQTNPVFSRNLAVRR